jgi:hypothetical protein
MGHGTQKKRVSYDVQPTSDQERAIQILPKCENVRRQQNIFNIIEELLSNGMLLR